MSKKKDKKPVFDDFTNDPYNVPALPVGAHKSVFSVFNQDCGVFVILNGDDTVYSVEPGGGIVNIFDMAGDVQRLWCEAVGIKYKHLQEYADQFLERNKTANAIKLLRSLGYTVAEPM